MDNDDGDDDVFVVVVVVVVVAFGFNERTIVNVFKMGRLPLIGSLLCLFALPLTNSQQCSRRSEGGK